MNTLKILGCALCASIPLSSCTVSGEQLETLTGLVEVAGVLMTADDAAKLETLQAIGGVIIRVEDEGK